MNRAHERLDLQTYVVYEDGSELPDSSFAAIQGAAAMWSENPESRTVYEIVPVLGTKLREVPASELRSAIGMLTGY